MSLVLDGEHIATPGRDTKCWVDDPRVPWIGDHPKDDGFARTPDRVQAVGVHTSKGRRGPLSVTEAGPSEKAEALARYQDTTPRDVSWHFTIDVDGTIVQSADPGHWACWHAGQVNGHTIGIELVQLDNLTLYPAQLEALVWLVGLLCDRYQIPKTVPVGPDGEPFSTIIPELMSKPEGDAGATWRGVYGHRNCSRRRGFGDPGNHPFLALLRAGFTGVRVDAKGRRVVTSAEGAPPVAVPPRAAPPPTAARRSWPALPDWIDPDQEITDTADLSIEPTTFVREALVHLLALGAPRERAIEVVAHCAVECRWGERAIGDNMGGVKLKQRDTEREERRSGQGLRWWRWAGHVASGDPPVVYYRGFESPRAFWAFWIERYAPRPGEPPENPRYTATGAAFWGGGDWFVAMILAGYRGEVRERELGELLKAGRDPAMHPSVRAHREVVDRVRALTG